MKLKSFFTTVFFAFAILSFAQSHSNQAVPYVEGEVLVQMDNASGLNALQSRYSRYGLQLARTVSARFHIFLLRFDQTKAGQGEVLRELRLEKSVLNAQNNHYVELRSINDTITPDDPLFADQWSLVNTGQDGGIPDADIDADEAWGITTGGFTALGDQIVVAIVDGGSDLNHEDLTFWKNTHEIPNNGVDDDTNGYVDDYDGWNAYNHTGQIPQHNHGVHVGGIAGATGNNGIGVSGVNWNVKILPVAGSSGSSEAIVVEALSYVYTIRERYDQTDGQEGAFVVADNCSFGVDKGNPAQFPIWEAMYDSLGQLGILSMGATANRPWDIDSVGDVPTAFTTDFMIAVTNTTKLDQLYLSAGWGDTTIDLGAPGTNVKSLRVNNGYGNSTGTSMATPHVTGAAALILSAADSAFMVNYKNQPAEGALLIKGFILDGVNELSSLVGKTVSGGRLNVFNSINLLLNAPVLQTDKDSVYIALGVNDTGEDNVLLTNTGIETLNYSVNIPDQPGWISLSDSAGTLLQSASAPLVLYFDTEGLDTGSYYCQVVITGNQIFSKTIEVEMLVDTNVGTDELRLTTKQVSVFPNPFTNRLTFEVQTGEGGELLLEVFDQLGKRVYTKQQNIPSGNIQFFWEAADAASGVFFYKISLNEQLLKSGKLVKK